MEEENENGTSSNSEPVSVDMEDGEYEVEVTLEGGSGRASVSSPAVLLVKTERHMLESSGAAQITII